MSRSVVSRRLPAGLLAAVALLATACGSTVQSGGSDALGAGAPAGAAADGLGGSGAAGADGLGGVGPAGTGIGGPAGGGSLGTTGTAGGGGSVGGAGGSAGAGGGSNTGASGAGAGQPGSSAGSVRQGPGVTATQIFVGARYAKNLEKAQAAYGGGGIDSGNPEANIRAMIAEVNARGGVAGRKLAVIFHVDDATSSDTGDAQDQAACETFTRDNKIAATIAGGGPVFQACMKKAGVLQVAAGGIIGYDKQSYADNPTFVSLGDVSQDRMLADLARALQRQAYFSGWDFTLGKPAPTKAKVGVLGWDFPDFKRPRDRVLLPALARSGHPVDPELVIGIQGTNGNQDAGRFAAEVSSAVLRFKGAGVTHLIILDSDGIITLTYTKNAENQNYFPRLGITSANGVQALYDAGIFAAKPFNGAMGVGWKPMLDLPQGQGARHLTSATKECIAVIKKRTGVEYTDPNAASGALAVCDMIYGIAAGYNRAGPILNVTTGVRGLESLGGSFRPAAVPKTFLGPGRHDGLETGFDLFWDTTCTCIKYRDNGHRIPAA